MATLTVHGFVQIWSRKMGMSRPKEAYIETVEIKKKIKLVVYFTTGEYITFRLRNNIKNVVLRSYGEKQNHLHLTLQNNSFLFIERLSSRDAEELKMFLDRVHQNDIQPSVRPGRDGGIFASMTTPKEINKISFHKACKKPNSGSFQTGEGSGTPDLQKMPLFASESSKLSCKDLLENGYRQRKSMLSSGSKMNGKILKNSNSARKKKSQTNPLRYVSHNGEKKMRLRVLKSIKKLEAKALIKTVSPGKPHLDGPGLLQMLSEEIYLAFLLAPKYNADDPEWDKLKMTFDFYPEKLWQGLPNLGNTCYMNAVLQSLFSIPSFADDLLSQDFPWGKISLGALSMYLAQLFVLKNIYNIKIKERLLVHIKKKISTVAEIFSGNIQNDAHEFLSHCLDQMKENMEKLNTIWKMKIESEENSSAQQVFAGTAATRVLICPVITNFEFELLRSIICQACGQVVLKTEVSNYLSINLPQGTKALPLSIQSAFDLFFRAEELEYRCEKCQHRSSVAVHKFSRLPRVLIVHLKRYIFNEFWLLRKDEQEVVISKYLKLSSHCSESTKPPLPVNKNAHNRDLQVLRVFQNMSAENLCPSALFTKLTSASSVFPVPHTRPNKEPEPQKRQILYEKSRREQQKKDLGKCSRLNTTESKLMNLGDGAVIEKELLAAGLMMDLEETSHSLIHDNEGKPTSGPETHLADIYLQEASENLKQKKYKKTNMFVGFESVADTTEDFYDGKKNRISNEFQKVAEHTQQDERMRLSEEALQQALLQALLKPRAQGYTKNLRRPTDLSLQGANVNSLGASGSNKNPGNKQVSDTEKTETEAKKPKGNAEMKDPYTYRLVAVVSHLGKTPNSGHYISDAYDFEKQGWFTYNDLQVSSIQEALMQEARLCTGYMFFYMHNEIFEELLKREENSQSRSTQTGETPQEK
ncbi:PREDICTED: ubiquitin carboxyl-terminal hydrolase 26 [Odobenus rosmarus divergens]|uniref:Ubiquitin carboxyl-terminal hydrolase n=1 Tax=Odobenus rosmarus divergens TaxID=9708 RepID=A0A2U3W007_ODORO|nr:PREDICTED: ubiquitin carboxyl-terminal hydrolase 26 [Odobenus rosmarus divergens]